MTKRKGPRPGTTLHWLSQRLDWPNDKLLRDERLEGKGLPYIHRARHQLRRVHGLGELAEPSKSHPRATKQKRKKRQKSTPKKSKQPQQLTALQLKISRVRKLIFEIGWDAARELFHEFEDTYSRWE